MFPAFLLTHVSYGSGPNPQPPTQPCTPYMSSTLSTLPAPLIGYLFLAGSALLLALGAHALLFSALFPSRAPLGGTGGTLGEWQWQWKRPNIIIIDIMIAIMNAVLDALARDAHYKYLALFSVPVCAYFVIANWVGWQFFRNS
ncbi:hypothetical protein BGY98DRAFT_931317 [Russula aff. rugulosa BPL654]|nr:hypothetical protein BGY98DRAFT_931317 [Russula aff. rugulosa BPL654]